MSDFIIAAVIFIVMTWPIFLAVVMMVRMSVIHGRRLLQKGHIRKPKQIPHYS